MYGERERVRWQGPDWRDVFGPEMSAGQIVAEARRRGVRVAELLAGWYQELAWANPDGWDEETPPDFEYLARKIEWEAAQDERNP